jgi:hypothetical protein
MEIQSQMFAAAPVLPCLDLVKTMRFYQQLGFETFMYNGYLIANYQRAELHFWETTDSYLANHSGCYIHVQQIEDFYQAYKQFNIIHPQGHLETKSWGMKEFAIIDNSGNLIRFGEAV